MNYANCNGCNSRLIIGEDDYTEIAPDVYLCGNCHYDFNEWYMESQERYHEIHAAEYV